MHVPHRGVEESPGFRVTRRSYPFRPSAFRWIEKFHVAVPRGNWGALQVAALGLSCLSFPLHKTLLRHRMTRTVPLIAGQEEILHAHA